LAGRLIANVPSNKADILKEIIAVYCQAVHQNSLVQAEG